VIEAGIFDVGGVLITNRMAHAWRDVLETPQLDESTFRAAWREMGIQLGNGRIEEEEFWRRVCFVESLPRNALGKVQKHSLREQLE
jgi:non-ribosomal peptide synthetase component E (peptide arylation enzyme)